VADSGGAGQAVDHPLSRREKLSADKDPMRRSEVEALAVERRRCRRPSLTAVLECAWRPSAVMGGRAVGDGRRCRTRPAFFAEAGSPSKSRCTRLGFFLRR